MEQPKRIFIACTAVDSAFGNAVVAALEATSLRPLVERRVIAAGGPPLNRDLPAGSYLVIVVSSEFLSGNYPRLDPEAARTSQDTVLVGVLRNVSASQLKWSAALPLVRIDASAEPQQAIAELLRFFAQEQGPLLPPGATGRSSFSSQSVLRTASRRTLRLAATRCLSDEDLRNFIFDAELEPEEFEGDSLHARILHLLHRVSSPGILEHFLDWLELERGSCVRRWLAESEAQPDWRLPAPDAPDVVAAGTFRRLFISCEPADSRWLERLRRFLRPHEKQGTLTRWDSSCLVPGAEVRHEIGSAIAAADVAVVLLSADYLAADAIAEYELPLLLKAAASHQLRLLVVLVRPCYPPPELSRYRVLQSGRSLSELGEAAAEQALLAVSQLILTAGAPA